MTDLSKQMKIQGGARYDPRWTQKLMEMEYPERGVRLLCSQKRNKRLVVEFYFKLDSKTIFCDL